MNKYIISKYVDSKAMNVSEIIDNFNIYLEGMDGSKLTKENRDLIIKLCNQYPILKILCSAMDYMGYESF